MIATNLTKRQKEILNEVLCTFTDNMFLDKTEQEYRFGFGSLPATFSKEEGEWLLNINF